MDTNITKELSTFLTVLDLDRVPLQVQEEGKRFLLDTLGCIVAGAQTEIGPLAHGTADLFGRGDEASVAGRSERSSVLAATYANGRLANCMDMDESHPGGPIAGLHFGVGVVAAALAVCESKGLTGRDLLLAVIAGYELGGRVSDVGTQLLIEDGRVVGMPDVWGIALPVVLGATAAAASLLRLDASMLDEAIGLAAGNSPNPVGPIWSSKVALPNTKYCDMGWCAATGLFGAMTAPLGSTGLTGIFDGEKNIFAMIGMNDVNPSLLLDELGERWALEDLTYKPWPSCRWHHHALTALVELRVREGLTPDQIGSIVVETNTKMLSPRFYNQDPPNFAARQFSFPHAVAMILHDVRIGPRWMSDEVANDPAISATRKKVTIEHNERTESFAGHFVRGQFRQIPTAVTVEARGRTYRAQTDFALGDPWDATTRWGDNEAAAKFRTVTGLPSVLAESAISAILDLENRTDMAPLADALRWSSSGLRRAG